MQVEIQPNGLDVVLLNNGKSIRRSQEEIAAFYAHIQAMFPQLIVPVKIKHLSKFLVHPAIQACPGYLQFVSSEFQVSWRGVDWVVSTARFTEAKTNKVKGSVWHFLVFCHCARYRRLF